MENQKVLRSKPLSYEASKAVLKSLKLETREAINRRIPALRTVNSRLPYILEYVVITDDYFETSGRSWKIRPVWVQISENPLRKVVDPENWKLILQFNKGKKVCYRVNKSPEEILEKLFDEYIKDGTVVRGTLCFGRIPEFLKRKSQNEEDLKMKVTNLELSINETKDYDYFIGFIDLDVFENVLINAYENSLPLLDKPEIKTCKNLTFYSCHLLETTYQSTNFFDRPTNLSIDLLLRLRNQRFKLKYYCFNHHGLQLLVQDWITTGRDIGTRFIWEPDQFGDVLPIMEHLKTHFGAHEAGSHLEYCFSDKVIYGNGITLKMGEDRKLVMYCCQDKTQSDYNPWFFEMEVVSSTTSAGTVPTPNV